MSWIKKQLPFLILLGIVYLSYFFTHVPSSTPKATILGADTNVTLFTQPESGQKPIVSALDSAQKEILMEIYLLSDKQIIAALENAAGRGVKVVVMFEDHPFGGGNLNTKTADELKSHGVQVGWTNNEYALTHQKSIVIDQASVFILNQNLTSAAFSKNREYNILDTNPTDVQEVRNIFIADWQRKPFDPTSTHLIISPKTSRNGITNLLQNSMHTLDLEIEDINDSQIVALLQTLAKDHQIRLLAPTISQISSNKDSLFALVSAGVQVKTLSSPYIHAKLILADDKKAYLGSVNLSAQSMDENRELGIILTDPVILQALKQTFSTDWDRGSVLSK